LSHRQFCLAVWLTVCVLGAAHSQEYPNRPLRHIVPYPPGGGVDLGTRIVTTRLSDFLGQMIVVDNRPGAGGNLGAELAAKATPDGYTLFTCQIASHAISPALYKRLPYDAMKDLSPISLIGMTPNVLVVHPSLPAKSVGEFISYAKANRGKLNFGSSGVGASPHLTMELFKTTTGIDLVHVPYKGGALALADLMGGHVQVMFDNLPGQLQVIKAGKVRALGVTSGKRAEQLPDIPTVSESGVPGFEVTVWYGMCVPAGVPKRVVAKLNAEVVKTLNLPDVKERLAQASIQAAPSSPEQFAAYIRSESIKWAKVIKDAGLSAD
ncbi:unnamed protein product, partial [Phaeothamnion confervicola]